MAFEFFDFGRAPFRLYLEFEKPFGSKYRSGYLEAKCKVESLLSCFYAANLFQCDAYFFAHFSLFDARKCDRQYVFIFLRLGPYLYVHLSISSIKKVISKWSYHIISTPKLPEHKQLHPEMWRSIGKGVLFKTFDVNVQVQNVN